MANHKWKNDNVLNIKRQTCTKCWIFREWLRGKEYQCWEYFIVRNFIAQNGTEQTSIEQQYERPECINKDDIRKQHYKL